MFPNIVIFVRAAIVPLSGALLQDRWHGWEIPTREQRVITGLLIVALAFSIVTLPWVMRRLARGPRIVAGEVAEFRRTAVKSESPNDLQVIYAKVRNASNGGGDGKTLANAEAWMEAFSPKGVRVAGPIKGNWFALHNGVPDTNPMNSVTLRPTGEEFGLEISGKFDWGEDAWVPGAVYPDLSPGVYEMRASVTDGVRKATVLKWWIVNPGKDARLALRDGPEIAPYPRREWTGVPSAAVTSASVSASEVGVSDSDSVREVVELTPQQVAEGYLEKPKVGQAPSQGPGIVASSFKRSQRDSVHSQDLEQERRHVAERSALQPPHASIASHDSLVRVAYATMSTNALSVGFKFPKAPVNKLGEIELAPHHGTQVEWVIELTNHLPRSVPLAHITVLAPMHLITYIRPLSNFVETKIDDCEENMVSDSDKGSLRFRGWFGPLMGMDNVTDLTFETTISHTREIPIRVQVVADELGNNSVYLPIRAVMAPDGNPVRGRL